MKKRIGQDRGQDRHHPTAAVSLRQMADRLAGLSTAQWGRYAFSREPLEGKFTPEQMRMYTEKADACGRQWADRMAAQYGIRTPRLLAQAMGLKVEEAPTPVGGGLVLFAQFVQPDTVTIFTDCIQKAASIQEESGCPLLLPDRLREILLGHELFHAVEERYPKEIYTRTEKIQLWRKPFSNLSSIACLSEIAAMAFAARLLDLTVSPYLLDVLLVYPYDQAAATGLYEEICSLAECVPS